MIPPATVTSCQISTVTKHKEELDTEIAEMKDKIETTMKEQEERFKVGVGRFAREIYIRPFATRLPCALSLSNLPWPQLVCPNRASHSHTLT